MMKSFHEISNSIESYLISGTWGIKCTPPLQKIPLPPSRAAAFLGTEMLLPIKCSFSSREEVL